MWKGSYSYSYITLDSLLVPRVVVNLCGSIEAPDLLPRSDPTDNNNNNPSGTTDSADTPTSSNVRQANAQLKVAVIQ
jgi:hypothetical protein